MLLIAETFLGGPVGIETIAAALSEPRDAIEDIVEPYLLQQGFIQRTARGRILTEKAWSHLGLSAPASTTSIQRRSQLSEAQENSSFQTSLWDGEDD